MKYSKIAVKNGVKPHIVSAIPIFKSALPQK
jgi:hypothetical protein